MRDDFLIHSCLPFLTIAADQPVQLGPVLFFPADKAIEIFDVDGGGEFLTYLESLSITPQSAMGIALHTLIPDNQKDKLFLDALFVIYFIAIHRDLYQNLPIPSIRTFTKYISASEQFILANKGEAKLVTSFRKTTVHFDQSDLALCEALGKVLHQVYLEDQCEQSKKSLIRSIRFFVDAFISQFENIIDTGVPLPNILFSPENVMCLNLAFEVLFDIDISHISSDFKQKLRPMLVLRYSRPVEMLWKWIDGYFGLFHSLTRSAEIPDIMFRANENYEFPFLHLGMKIYIYAVMHKLYLFKFLTPSYTTEDMPPFFHSIDPMEIIVYLWTEEGLLKKISIILMQLGTQPKNEELQNDVFRMTSVFNAKIRKFYLKTPPSGIQFIPQENPQLEKYARSILDALPQTIERKGEQKTIKSFLPEYFEENIRNHILGSGSETK